MFTKIGKPERIATYTHNGRLQYRYYIDVKCDNCGKMSRTRLDRIANKHCRCQVVRKSRLSPVLQGLHKIYQSVHSRCSPANARWVQSPYYAGAGITCDLGTQEEFVAWALAQGYQPGMIMIRNDKNGNYTQENCSFVSDWHGVQQNRRDSIYLTAWGETKTISAWTDDPRTHPSLSNSILQSRVYLNRLNGRWTPEEMLTTPKGQRMLTVSFRDGEAVTRDLLVLTAWGETKTIAAWMLDARVDRSLTAGLVRSRAKLLQKNARWTPEEILTTPKGGHIAIMVERDQFRFNTREPTYLTAWGETKTIAAWAADERTHPSLDFSVLYCRKGLLKNGHWTPEEILTTPKGKHTKRWRNTF